MLQNKIQIVLEHKLTKDEIDNFGIFPNWILQYLEGKNDHQEKFLRVRIAKGYYRIINPMDSLVLDNDNNVYLFIRGVKESGDLELLEKISKIDWTAAALPQIVDNTMDTETALRALLNGKEISRIGWDLDGSIKLTKEDINAKDWYIKD